jgi:hypothetical protein
MLLKVGAALFTYGFAREMRAEYPKDKDLFGTRLIYSVGNGIEYVLPPITFMHMINLINRVDICLTNKDKNLYKTCYKEVLGQNWNAIL